MTTPRTLRADGSSSDGLEGELPVQPSSLPSPSADQPLAAMTPTAEPIPPNELPAASPLPDRRERGSTRSAWSLALILIVLAIAGAGIVAAAKNTSSDPRDPAETAPRRLTQ